MKTNKILWNILDQPIIMKTIKIFLLLISLYLLLGVIAYFIPDRAVYNHLRTSVDRGNFDNDYPKAIIQNSPCHQDPYTLDFFTDALILNQVANIRSMGISSVLLLPRYDKPQSPMYFNLSQTLLGATDGNIITYARYWHGTTFLTRILLFFSTYGISNTFFMFSQLFLYCGAYYVYGCMSEKW